MTNMTKRLTFALLIAGVALAQAPAGEVRGKVVSSHDSQPLALGQVQLTGTPFRAVTAEDGTFRMTGVPAGHYVLQTATVGYYQLRQEFDLTAGETRNFDA